MLECMFVLVVAVAIVLLMMWVISKCPSLGGGPWLHGKTLVHSSISSSTGFDDSYIGAESYNSNKYKRRKTRKHRSQRRNKNQSVGLCRPPGWINLQGPLARTTQVIAFNRILHELQFYQNRQPSQNLQAYLNDKFDMSRKDDMAVMSLIQGTYAAWYMTGETQQALTRCKQILHDIQTYHLKYSSILESQVYWNMYYYYMMKGKAGKAHSALRAAVSCIQHHAPSSWIAEVCELQAYLYERLAQTRPGHRSKYQNLALGCLTNARDQCLYQQCQDDETYFYYLIYYTLFMVSIKLDMPTMHAIAGFSGSEIVYRRLSDCVLLHPQVTEAQDMLTGLTPHLTKLTAEYRADIDESLLIFHIILNIRLTQLAVSEQKNQSALNHITTASDVYDEWSTSQYSTSVFKTFPYFHRDIKKSLENLYTRLILICRPSPSPEPLSDSMSSELSDAPPSGLKQLTAESRRAEKQARRDAHQFSYSSGDIHTDRQADMPSDVN